VATIYSIDGEINPDLLPKNGNMFEEEEIARLLSVGGNIKAHRHGKLIFVHRTASMSNRQLNIAARAAFHEEFFGNVIVANESELPPRILTKLKT
jgi:hypothetical protein